MKSCQTPSLAENFLEPFHFLYDARKAKVFCQMNINYILKFKTVHAWTS